VLSLMEGFQFDECYCWMITQTKCQKQKLKCVYLVWCLCSSWCV